MKNDIFDFSDYKKYVNERVKVDKGIPQGARIKMANFLRCQPTYLSQVLNRKPHFTLEQASLCCLFFSLDEVETKYFLSLVGFARAGSKKLKLSFAKQLQELRDERFNFKKRLKELDGVSLENQKIFYCAWNFSAIHILLAVPDFQDPEYISKRLRLPVNVVTEVTKFLEHAGLIEKINGKLEITTRLYHLSKDSVFNRINHINWRSQALQSVERSLPEDVHYSCVLAISNSDSVKLKTLIFEFIKNFGQVVDPSACEEAFSLSLDFFKL